MVLNEKEKLYKNYLALKEADNKNYQEQRALGYIELEKPIPNGWKIVFTLRDDIQRREDADVFWEILDIASRHGFIRNKNIFLSKKKKYRGHPYHPEFHSISEKTYESLRPAVKKYFHLDISCWTSWGFKPYNCHLPSYYIKEKLVRSYIKEVKVIDEVLLQEQAEIRAQLDYYKYSLHISDYNRNKAPKQYVKAYNRRYRKNSKKIIKRYLREGIEGEYGHYGRHTAAYDFW